MSIDYSDVFSILAEALPEFAPSEADLEDRLSYPFLSEMVRFLCNRAYPEFPEYDKMMREFASLIEKLISDGDSNVHDLAHDGLESVWEHREERDVISNYFGPKTQEL
jgi:hypothetical protein